MVGSGTKPPILSLVFGAVCGYYGFSLARSGISVLGILFFLFIPVLPLCLFRVLARFPGDFFSGPRRRFYALGEQHAAAFSLGLVLGLASGGTVPRNVSLGIPEEAIIGLTGVLRDDPRTVSGGRGLGILSLEKTAGRGGIRSSAKGRIAVFFPDETLPRLKEFGRGSRVYVEGLLVSGGRKGPFSGGETLLFRASSVHLIKPAPALEQFRTGLRLELIRRFSSGPGLAGGGEGWGGLALALLLGIRDNLDHDLAGLYQKAGSSHILALSGMHLAIISALIAFFLRRPLGLKAAAVLGALFIVFYVFLVGPQPSLIRAAVMYLLGTLAVLGALPKRPGILLGLSFLVQISLWPESGLTISFILSYLALGGILTIGAALVEMFRGKIPGVLLQPLSASLGAFLATAGVTAFFFGVLRPVGMGVGLVIVPLTTIFMILSLIWLALGLLYPPLASLLGQGISPLYRLMDSLISLAAKVPGLPASRPLWILCLSLGLSVFIIWFGNYSRALKRRVLSFD
jgi:competence protein ComEC